jgi:hypothetical protein
MKYSSTIKAEKEIKEVIQIGEDICKSKENITNHLKGYFEQY